MKLTIVGGGVSGVIAAIYAAKKNIDVTILERNDKMLKKLLITGNGRCNYFNDDQDLKHYHSSNPELIKNIINETNINELKSFYKNIGVIPKIIDGYYYPYSNQASSVRELLIHELESLNVNIKYNYLVNDIKKESDKFIINDEIVTDKLIISTGSKAYPKTGSDGIGYELLKSFNLNISNIYPALVQVKAKTNLKDLAGVRCNASLRLYGNDKLIKKEVGELQFTDYGISGICTFNLSYLLSNISNKYIMVNFIDGIEKEVSEFIKLKNDKTIEQIFEGFLNYKITRYILKILNIDKDQKWIDLDNKKQELIINTLKNFKIEINGTNGFDKSQVCHGGLYLTEVNVNTMESLKIKNLYIVGELLDIDADCGGYNLTNAFITGYIAGDNIDKS